MKIDVARQIGAISRIVTRQDRDGRPVDVVVASRIYDTTVEDLWDALTSAERLPRWFLPITGDLRPGGRYQLEGNAGGAIVACEPPRHLALTWEYGGDTSWVEVRLRPEGQGARLELEHQARVPPEFWDRYGPGAVGVGWDLALMGLARHLAGAPPLDPAEVAAFGASEEGRAFHRESASAWGRAHAVSGVDPVLAAACAERTRAFYDGEATGG